MSRFTEQGLMETCRVRFTHHRMLEVKGSDNEFRFLWCAERTLLCLNCVQSMFRPCALRLSHA